MQEQTIQCELATRRLAGKTAMVVGANRGLGRGIAAALGDAGADVVAISRTEGALDAAAVRWELADAADADVPTRLLGRYDPDVVVIVAGAAPPMLPLQQHSWESFFAARLASWSPYRNEARQRYPMDQSLRQVSISRSGQDERHPHGR
jgi:NAD(P)-dependent dehydrogenase (short-subunit alcohol dehydrogenase family)